MFVAMNRNNEDVTYAISASVRWSRASVNCFLAFKFYFDIEVTDSICVLLETLFHRSNLVQIKEIICI